jgi:mRNA-degrading endonuclease YafQ of YafQ-DinJ toxin-antitoxin module
MIEIYYSSKFAKLYKKLPQKIKMDAEQKEKIFRRNPFDAQLNTHKLHGRLKKLLGFFY